MPLNKKKIKKNLVSVIIPTFNCEKYIQRTINSILNQTYQNFELIIVDDCSTDKTFKILKDIQSKNPSIVKLYQTKKNSGTASTPRNLGLKYCNGELICFVDGDDSWNKKKLEYQVLNSPKKKTLYTTSAKYYYHKEEKTNFLINIIRGFLQRYVIKKINSKGFFWFYIYNPIIVSSVLIHRDVFKKNKFDENINTREDLDLWIRLRKQNYNIHFNSKKLVNIHKLKTSLSSNINKELILIVRSLSDVSFKINNFSYVNYFLFGIMVKFFLTFIKVNKLFLSKLIKRSILFFSIIYFVTFYTPLFWNIAKPLLHYDELSPKDLKSLKNIVIFSGHGSTEYYNITYRSRYKDVKDVLKKIENFESIYIIGRLQEIPTQKIIEKLLIADGIEKEKIHVIYENYNSTSNNIDNIKNLLNKKKISNIIFITSPYHSKRAKLLWDQHKDISIKFWKSYKWPEQNNFFEYAKNKKLIIYEYSSIMYNILIGNIK